MKCLRETKGNEDFCTCLVWGKMTVIYCIDNTNFVLEHMIVFIGPFIIYVLFYTWATQDFGDLSF